MQTVLEKGERARSALSGLLGVPSLWTVEGAGPHFAQCRFMEAARQLAPLARAKELQPRDILAVLQPAVAVPELAITDREERSVAAGSSSDAGPSVSEAAATDVSVRLYDESEITARKMAGTIRRLRAAGTPNEEVWALEASLARLNAVILQARPRELINRLQSATAESGAPGLNPMAAPIVPVEGPAFPEHHAGSSKRARKKKGQSHG